MADKTIESIISDLTAQLGGAVRSESFAPLARIAVLKAIDHAPYYNFREEVFQDLTGFTIVNPSDSKRFELTGNVITVNIISKQHLPYGLEATYDHLALYRPRVNDLEHGIGVDGNAKANVATLSFEVPIAAGRKVRVWYKRKVEQPATDQTVIPLDEAYLDVAPKMFFHEELSSRQIAGDSTNHAWQAQNLAKQLAALKRRRVSIRVRNDLWKPDR